MKRRDFIGHAPVDSGHLLIIDPCYISDEWKPTSFNSIFKELERTGGQVLEWAAVATHCRNGDGIFPIFAEYGEDGEIERVVIDFLTPPFEEREKQVTDEKKIGESTNE